MNSPIRIENISKRFGQTPVLAGLTLEVPARR